ncbi:MAG TPA: hypothetical protein VG165_13715 [Solirubrobacteraceae bacterium]|nr:hypothetical protein [Solirubrobacteraceae bacterium]
MLARLIELNCERAAAEQRSGAAKRLTRRAAGRKMPTAQPERMF